MATESSLETLPGFENATSSGKQFPETYVTTTHVVLTYIIGIFFVVTYVISAVKAVRDRRAIKSRNAARRAGCKREKNSTRGVLTVCLEEETNSTHGHIIIILRGSPFTSRKSESMLDDARSSVSASSASSDDENKPGQNISKEQSMSKAGSSSNETHFSIKSSQL